MIWAGPAKQAGDRRRGGGGGQPAAAPNRDKSPVYNVGLFVPLSSAAAVWGPSCAACAELAVDEINRAGGLSGREINLITVDAGARPEDVADVAEQLLDCNAIDAVVGMHISNVREALAPRIAGRVPYVYTPLYEGGEFHPGVYAIGETPEDQLKPALTWMAMQRGARRWALVGNDYVWPRANHALARRFIADFGGDVVDEVYLPLGTEDYEPCLERLAETGADAVLVSLVGQDAIAFNRAFGEHDMHRRMLRLSTAMDENTLLGIGVRNTINLFAASGYFTSLETDANHAFIERYRSRFGMRAPVPGALGQSVYEGFSFLNAALKTQQGRPVRIPGVRGSVYLDNSRKGVPIYLAEADGVGFHVLPKSLRLPPSSADAN
jgi:ABC-type branched-subunit amino acid transport system substrate-binding protein